MSRLRLEPSGDVLTIVLDRPDVRNALDEQAIAELTEALRGPASDSGVRFVVLRGEGKVFCAGADLDYMRRLAAADDETNQADARRLGALFDAIAGCPHPVIAAVHGAAIGGGIGLVAAADLVVATEDTKFGFTEVRLGIVPGVISPYAVRRLGPAVAAVCSSAVRSSPLPPRATSAWSTRSSPSTNSTTPCDRWLERLAGRGARGTDRREAAARGRPRRAARRGGAAHAGAHRAPAGHRRGARGFRCLLRARPPSWSPEAKS